tara:strand:- start:749 stop:958 length:210 start_codon:yes stop_codon:yes gene_type:complete
MGRRLASALLSLIITMLKFSVNMLTIGISFVTSKNLPLVSELFEDKNEAVVETREEFIHESQYDSPIKY